MLLPEAEVRVVRSPARLQTEVQNGLKEGCQLIVAGGGDGTVSTVAAELASTTAALGILPLGTWNHFAKDLRLPLDLAQAAKVIHAGHTQAVDVGDVNGHVFINNASLGLYPRLANIREKQRRRGWRRVSAMIWASFGALLRHQDVQVRLEVDGQPYNATTPLVFVGNNVYETEGLGVGSRSALTDGKLCLCVAPPVSRLGLFRLPLLALLGRLHQAKGFQMMCTTAATVQTRRQFVRVATDGEVSWMHSPLRFSIRQRALRVVVPE